MCGISGVYSPKGSVREKDVLRMRDAASYRGPDSEGAYLSPSSRVGLGHRRLAIIDLTPAGAQPMSYRGLWITYNGEIYNFKELRRELESRGHSFQSQSDTEVILAAYAEWGEECVRRLNGMFAFAIWDEKEGRLFCARDHLGVKPFYYALQNGVFYFGSEIKSILAHPDFKKDIEPAHISYYLTYGAMPAPYTLFKNIKKLPPASSLLIASDGSAREKEYWNPLSSEFHHHKHQSEEYYTERVRELLTESTMAQMVSDVPFGCFLSGGIDSSVNAALMSRALGTPVETFSIGTNEHEKYNEFEYSRATAKLLGANTHERVIGRKEFVEFFAGNTYAKHADDPNADYVCVMVYHLSELIRESGVIVAQVGEGSDELFAGYEPYKLAVRLHDKLWSALERLPSPLRSLPYRFSRISSSPKHDFAKQYLRRLARGEEPFWGLAIGFTPLHKENLFISAFQNTLSSGHEYEVVKRYYDKVQAEDSGADFLEKMTYLELKNRLAELLLMRVDKFSMARSIETRVPFLDHRLVELGLHIPTALKLKRGTTKHILKQAVRGIIPDTIIDRKKQGFGAPVYEWLADKEKSKPFYDMIQRSKLKELGVLDYEYVDKLFATHAAGKANNGFRIWTLLTLSRWYDYWMV